METIRCDPPAEARAGNFPHCCDSQRLECLYTAPFVGHQRATAEDRYRQRRVVLGHAHQVGIARGHPRARVAQQLLHGSQITSVQMAEGGGRVAQRMVRDARALEAGLHQVIVRLHANVPAAQAAAAGVGSGAQLLQTLAIAVIGGVGVSMVLSLLITPVLYYQLRRRGL